MNELKKIHEFQKVLSQYQLSDSAKATLHNTKLVLLVGPSSSGRNTIINQLVKSGDYYFVVSDTTRKPRVNNGKLEQDGREYWFREENDVLADLQAGKFLEAAIIHNQQVSGISIRELEIAASKHKIAIDEIEVVGADNIHALSSEAQFIFIVPPSFDEWITRMNARGELPAEETKRRLRSAVMEIKTALSKQYYTFVVNDTFMQTARRVDSLIRQGTSDDSEQVAAKAIAQQLMTDTQNFLDRLDQSVNI